MQNEVWKIYDAWLPLVNNYRDKIWRRFITQKFSIDLTRTSKKIALRAKFRGLALSARKIVWFLLKRALFARFSYSQSHFFLHYYIAVELSLALRVNSTVKC